MLFAPLLLLAAGSFASDVTPPPWQFAAEAGAWSLTSACDAANVRINVEDTSRAVFAAPWVTTVVPFGISAKRHFVEYDFATLGVGGRVSYWTAGVPATAWTREDGSWRRSLSATYSSWLFEGEAILRLDRLRGAALFPFVSASFGIERNSLSFGMDDVDLAGSPEEPYRYAIEGSATAPVFGFGLGVDWAPTARWFAGLSVVLRAGPDVAYTATSVRFTPPPSWSGGACAGPHVPCAAMPLAGNTIPSADPGGEMPGAYSGAAVGFRLGARF